MAGATGKGRQNPEGTQMYLATPTSAEARGWEQQSWLPQLVSLLVALLPCAP